MHHAKLHVGINIHRYTKPNVYIVSQYLKPYICLTFLYDRLSVYFQARIQNVLSEGSSFDTVYLLFFILFFILVNEGIEDPYTAKSGPSSAHRRNAIYMAFRWRADDCPTLNAGLIALWFSGDLDRYCYETLCFCDFSRGSGPPVPPLDPPMILLYVRLCMCLLSVH